MPIVNRAEAQGHAQLKNLSELMTQGHAWSTVAKNCVRMLASFSTNWGENMETLLMLRVTSQTEDKIPPREGLNLWEDVLPSCSPRQA